MAPNTCAESSNKPESHQPVKPLRGAHSSHNTGASDSSWETRAHSQLGFFLWFKLTEGHLPNINIQSRWTRKGRPYTGMDFGILDTVNIVQQQTDDGRYTGLQSWEQLFMKTAQFMRANVYMCTLSAEDLKYRHGSYYRHKNTPSLLEYFFFFF